MSDFTLETPVAFMVFNRPEKTARVFERIREARPKQLLVVADGPRATRPEETQRVAAVRRIIDTVDWDCEVIRNYADENLGCGKRISSGLSWVFNTVEQAIVLEDDCLPHPTFFRFCQEMLQRYAGDTRVMHVCGTSVMPDPAGDPQGYTFSCFNYIWGWASWRRAWQHYDFTLSRWPVFKQRGLLRAVFDAPQDMRYWENIFDLVSAGKMDTWDFQWTFTCWSQGGLCVVPNVNLITNIGFDAEATESKKLSPLANVPALAAQFPLQHPPFVVRDRRRDQRVQDAIFQFPTLFQRARDKVVRLSNRIRGRS